MLNVGGKVAWRTMFGELFAGEIIYAGIDSHLIRRVDGGTCIVKAESLRQATNDDIMESIEIFKRKGLIPIS